MHRPELLRYHPNRFSASRDYFRTLHNRYRDRVRADGVSSIQQYRDIFGSFASTYWNPHLAEVPLAERPRNTKRLHEEFDMFTHVAQFFHGGRNVFHFSRQLIELLKLTDVDDVLWESIKIPYACFYLWFGPQDGWWFGKPGYLADGTYVNELFPQGARVLELMVTTVSSNAPALREWNYAAHDDPYYYFSFEVGGPESTVRQTFQKRLATSHDFNNEWPRAEIPAEMEELAAGFGKRLRALPRVETAQGHKVQERLQGLPVFREVLKLVVNCLCYLCSPSREVTERYPDSEITRVIGQARTPLERARAEKRAVREGYTLIHFCGDSLESRAEGIHTGRELSAHWRRGHWRNQAVGPGRSEHKLMWIRPTLVREDKADLGIPGHVYDVDHSR